MVQAILAQRNWRVESDKVRSVSQTGGPFLVGYELAALVAFRLGVSKRKTPDHFSFSFPVHLFISGQGPTHHARVDALLEFL